MHMDILQILALVVQPVQTQLEASRVHVLPIGQAIDVNIKLDVQMKAYVLMTQFVLKLLSTLMDTCVIQPLTT